MRVVVALMLGLVASVAAAQQGRGTPSATRVERNEPAVPFRAGETLTYDVSWSSTLVAGTAVTAVREKRPSLGSTAYYIVAEGRPLPLLARLYNLYYKMDTLIDSFTLLSQRGALYVEEGADHQTGTTRFDRAARRAFFELRTGQTAKVDFAVPAQTQDGLAMLYALRARPLKTGDRITTPVADGGALYTVTIEVGAPGRVKVPLGEFAAWQLAIGIVDAERQPVWKNITVWISSDTRRLPVKLQAELPVGQFVLALREAASSP